MMPRLPLPLSLSQALRRVAGAALLGLFLCACHEDDHFDATPPAPPSGLDSVTGDTQVFVIWLPNREPDLAGYRIWRNSDGGDEYFLVDDFAAYDPDYYEPASGPGTDWIIYDDNGLVNGREYWYAVTAYDDEGNESELSYEFLRDVPRPEGQMVLYDAAVAPQFSGIDFSRAPLDDNAQAWDLASTDAWLEYDADGVPFFVTPLPTGAKEVRVQDYGFADFNDLTWAPSAGYSRTGIVEVVEGHAYAFEIVADPDGSAVRNYAKLWVADLDGDSALLWWGYQEVAGEPELVQPDDLARHSSRVLPTEVQP
jgi:hypothetical protein